MGKYKIKISKNHQYYWVLVARNGKAILTSSEQYTQKHNCNKSIAASKRSLTPKCLTQKVWFDEPHFYNSFLQYAKNGECLGKSEVYTSKRGTLRGINSVIKNAPTAIIIDETV